MNGLLQQQDLAEQQTHPNEEPLVQPSDRSLTILYVDDEPHALKALQRNTRHHPWKLIALGSAQEAIDFVFRGDEEIDLAILDLMMPDMDGFELLRSLRFFDPLLPVIILTASEDSQAFFQALELGCDGYLEKPYHLNTLNRLIQTVLPRRERTELPTDDMLLFRRAAKCEHILDIQC